MPETPSARVRAHATIRDVAALADVGIKTVSRVINNEPNVAALTHRKVMRAIHELNYHPNYNAGSLRRSGGKTQTLGLVVGNVANRFWGAVHRGVEDVATDRQIAVLAASLDDDVEREDLVVGELLRRRVDGLILATAKPDQSVLIVEQQRGLPIVYVDREPEGIDADMVLTNNRTGAEQGTAHLISYGHRRIGYLGEPATLPPAQRRRLGFVDALAVAGIAAESVPVVDDLHDSDAARAAVVALLSGPNAPTALFSSQNHVTIGALLALRELGLQRRVALVGFNDLALADLIEPGLTAMAQNPYQMGRIAAARAFARLDGDAVSQRIVVRSVLIPRGSGEIPPPD